MFDSFEYSGPDACFSPNLDAFVRIITNWLLNFANDFQEIIELQNFPY